MERRYFVKVCASAVVVCAASIAGTASAVETQVWKASDVHPLGYPTVEAIVRMGKKLEKETNGRITIQMYPSMQLGGEKEMIEQAQVGALQIARISVGAMGPVVDELNVFNLPFIFRDEAHMRKVIDGPIGQRAAREDHGEPAVAPGRARLDGRRHAQRLFEQAGDQARGPEGPEDPHDGQPAVRRDDERDGRQRRRDGLQRAVRRAADRRGRRCREQSADAAGAEPLHGQQGVQPDRAPDHSRDLRLLEAHAGTACPRADQELLRKLSREAQFEQRQLWDAYVGEAEAKLKAAGVKFVPADKAAFYKATQPIRDKYGAKYAALLKQIEETK